MAYLFTIKKKARKTEGNFIDKPFYDFTILP